MLLPLHAACVIINMTQITMTYKGQIAEDFVMYRLKADVGFSFSYAVFLDDQATGYAGR